MADVRTLAGRYEAEMLAREINVAYWMDETPDAPGYHLNSAHDLFAKLAEEMGYTIERIERGEVAA